MGAPLHACCNCKQLKQLTEFKLRVKDDRHGKKGEPTSKCTECTIRSQILRQQMKRKHDNDDAEEPMDLWINDSALPVHRFTTILANQASDGSLSCRMCVITEGMVEDSKGTADIIAGHIWEATGYRLTVVDSTYNVACINC